MRKLFATLQKLLRKDEEGAGLVEYALLVALIAVACVTAIGLMSNEVQNAFNSIANALKNAF